MDSTYQILNARPEHIPRLPEIEHSAAGIYPDGVLPQRSPTQTTSIQSFEAACRRGQLWVAITTDNNPVGFALAEEHGRYLHLEELDVHPDHQGRGNGTALLEAVQNYAMAAGYQGITLTTFANIPWNAPWYERMGFRILKPAELSPELEEILRDEARRGLDPNFRVAMLKSLKN